MLLKRLDTANAALGPKVMTALEKSLRNLSQYCPEIPYNSFDDDLLKKVVVDGQEVLMLTTIAEQLRDVLEADGIVNDVASNICKRLAQRSTPLVNALGDTADKFGLEANKEPEKVAQGLHLGFINLADSNLRKSVRPGSGSPTEKNILAQRARVFSLLSGIIRQPVYDLEDKTSILTREAPYDFAKDLVNDRGDFVKGRILEVGPGTGSDLYFMGQQPGVTELTVVDINKSILDMTRDRLQKGKQSGDIAQSVRIEIPEDPEDMFSFFERVSQKGERYDLVYGHSTFHYCDDRLFVLSLQQLAGCLNPDGHIAFCIKAPGATFESEGLQTYRDEHQVQPKKDGGKATWKSGSINSDLSMRFFRHPEYIKSLIKKEVSWLEFVQMTERVIFNYEHAHQGPQNFLGFVYRRCD